MLHTKSAQQSGSYFILIDFGGRENVLCDARRTHTVTFKIQMTTINDCTNEYTEKHRKMEVVWLQLFRNVRCQVKAKGECYLSCAGTFFICVSVQTFFSFDFIISIASAVPSPQDIVDFRFVSVDALRKHFQTHCCYEFFFYFFRQPKTDLNCSADVNVRNTCHLWHIFTENVVEIFSLAQCTACTHIHSYATATAAWNI